MDARPKNAAQTGSPNDGSGANGDPAKLTPRVRSPRILRTLGWAIAIAFLITGLIWGAWLEFPAGPAEGTALSGGIAPDLAGQTSLRIGTFNIHGGRGLDGRRDLDRIAACLNNLDFVGLNEVHGAPVWAGNDQASLLGKKLGLPWLFAPTEQCWSGNHFGSAILTKLPISRWERVPLDFHDGNGFRNFVDVQIPIQGGQLHLLVTHLDRRTDRHAQLATVFKRFLTLEAPVVLMGDMNTTAEDPQMHDLLATPGVVDCVGAHVAPDPPKRIDWILVRGLRCVDAGLTEVGASDHPHAWAELQLPAGTALESVRTPR